MPSDINVTINSIIQQSRRSDPATAEALIALAGEIRRIANIVDPAPVVEGKISDAPGLPPLDVLTGEYSFTDTNVIITWTAPTTDILLYEIRQGATWASATRVTITGTLQVILDPIAVGTTPYLIKSLNESGIYSLNALEIDVVVPAIGSFALTSAVINNFVSVDWEEPVSTFRISYYSITKDAALVLARNSGTFFSRQESVGGTYTYGVTAVDIYGNESAEMQITIDVGSPTDFDLQDSATSNLSGTIVNGIVGDDDKLYVCVDTATTYEQHFTNNAWASPQAQVDAGYPLWIQPTETTASYEEVFDFGVIYTNVIVNLSWLFEIFAGSFTFDLDVRVSDDNITYSTAYTSSSFFVTSARYVKVHFDFNGSSDTALMAFSEFVCTLNVRREVDGSDQDVFAADASGTVVNFIKAFKFVESITVTADSTTQKTCVYDFAGGVDPTSFKVKVYDAAGARIDAHISWKARGVL